MVCNTGSICSTSAWPLCFRCCKGCRNCTIHFLLRRIPWEEIVAIHFCDGNGNAVLYNWSNSEDASASSSTCGRNPSRQPTASVQGDGRHALHLCLLLFHGMGCVYIWYIQLYTSDAAINKDHSHGFMFLIYFLPEQDITVSHWLVHHNGFGVCQLFSCCHSVILIHPLKISSCPRSHHHL